MVMDMIEEIIAASKKPPVIIKGVVGGSNSVKSPKKVHFQKDVPNSGKDSRRSAGLEASRISSLHGRKKGQEVVLHLIENTVTAKELEKMCRYIIPGQYEDVCLERCISGVCGYPLCSVPYKDNYGNKEVIFRNNKVYDISRRRNYCSDVCFEASASVSGQISFTPHYLREHETWEELVVTVPDSSTLKGLRGDLRDIGGDTEFAASMRNMRRERLKQKSGPQPATRTVEEAALAGLLGEDGTTATTEQEQLDSRQDQQATPTLPSQNITAHSQTNMTSIDASPHDKKNGSIENLVTHKKESKKKHKLKNHPKLVTNEMSTSSQLGGHVVATEKDNTANEASLLARLDSQAISSTGDDSSHCNDTLNTSTDDLDEKTSKKALPRPENSREGSRATTTEGLVKQVEEHFLEWLTWDSYVLVLGETFLQRLLESHGLMTNHRIQQQPAFESALDSEMCRLRYWRLCSQLARQERLEELEAASVAAEDRPRPSKDAPDMETLRQDVQKMALKVKCFLSGREEPAQEDLPPEEREEEQRDEQNPLPLVDRYEQRAWRRKVFFENVHKAEQAVVSGLALSGKDVRPLLSHLITTFNLTSHNLYLRNPQWTLVLLVLLKLLGVRYLTISSAFTDVTLLQREVWPRLETLALPPEYLDILIPRLLDRTTIMNKFMEGAGSGSTMPNADHNAAQSNTSEYESNIGHEGYSSIEALD